MVLLGVGLAAWWNAQRFTAAFRLVDHTHEVLYRLEETTTKLLVLQSSSRTFALTASEALLKNYDADESALHQSLRELRGLVADNPAQTHRLDRVDPLVAQILGLLRERIALRRTAGLEAVAQTRVNPTGRSATDLFRELIDEMEAEERQLLRERSAESQSAARTTTHVVLAGSGLAACFAAAAGWRIRRDLADHRRIERSLQHERYLLGELMANSTEAIYFKDRDSRFLRVNRCVSDRFGLLGPRDVIGRSDADFFAPEHAQQARADEAEVMRTGQPITRTEQEIWPDGRVTWALTSKLPLRDAAGQIVGTFGVSHDVTELKLAQQTAAREEARLKFIFDTMPVGLSFALVQRDARVTRLINDAHLRICGLTREQADDPENFRRISHPEDYERQAVLARQLDAGEIDRFTIDKRYLRPDGETVWVMLSFLRRPCDDGSHEDLSMVVDITERHRAEEALRLSEARYRLLFTSLDEGFCVIEMIFNAQNQPVDYRFLEVSPSFERQTGLRDAVGKRMRELAPLHEAHWFEIYGRIALTGEPARFQNRAEQLHRWYDVYAFRFGEPEKRQVAILFNDISERKRAEAALAERTAQLEAVNKELEAFSYSVSHDLRAPLRHIDGFANLLTKRSAAVLDAQSQHYVATISAAAKQMGRLIDDLLSFSRMGRMALRRTPVDQNALIAALIQEGHYDQNGANIAWDIAPLPTVTADAAMLRQVWSNLIENAVKYSGKNPRPRIAIGCLPADDHGVEQAFFVRDNGVGFDMAYADKLFGVFQRLHSSAEFDGTGIGLANVRRVIVRHGGRTWAEGRVGEGALFGFSLPVIPPPS